MARMGDANKNTDNRQGRIAHVVSRVLAIVAIALAVEVLVFNANYFRTMGNIPVDLTPQLQGHLPHTEDGDYQFTVAAKKLTREKPE